MKFWCLQIFQKVNLFWHISALVSKMGQIKKSKALYYIGASSRLSWLVAHSRIFRLFMKGKFDAYVVWHLVKRVQNWIVDPSTARNFTVLKNLSLDIAPIDLFIIIQLKFVLPSQLDVGCNKAWKKKSPHANSSRDLEPQVHLFVTSLAFWLE